MKSHLSQAVLSTLLFLLVGSARADIVVYDANAMYYANESNVGTRTNSSFGPYTVGWGNTIAEDGPITGFTAFLSSEFGTGFAGNSNMAGFATNNPQIVPAAVINIGTLPGSGFAGLEPGEILLHPGGRDPSSGFLTPYFNGVLRFVVPTTGEYTIVGAFRSIDLGATLNEIGLNGSRIFSVDDPANSTYGTSYAFDLAMNLTAGDILDFAVNTGIGNSIGNDSTGLTLVVTQVPEPGTWALLSLGLVAAGVWRRNRRGKPAPAEAFGVAG